MLYWFWLKHLNLKSRVVHEQKVSLNVPLIAHAIKAQYTGLCYIILLVGKNPIVNNFVLNFRTDFTGKVN